jgi:lipoate-protein ligase B
MAKRLQLMDLGLMDYGRALELQENLVRLKRGGEKTDYLLFVEHPPVYTLGRGGDERHLLQQCRGGFETRSLLPPVYRVSRGGDATFHGPGQLVGYPILDLNHQGQDVHLYLRQLEAILIEALADFGLQAERLPGLTGVWVGGKKVASLGVGVRRWISFHGFALNVNTNLRFFDRIIPCGLYDVQMTSMLELLGKEVPLHRVKEVVGQRFMRQFRYTGIAWHRTFTNLRQPGLDLGLPT